MFCTVSVDESGANSVVCFRYKIFRCGRDVVKQGLTPDPDQTLFRAFPSIAALISVMEVIVP